LITLLSPLRHLRRHLRHFAAAIDAAMPTLLFMPPVTILLRRRQPYAIYLFLPC